MLAARAAVCGAKRCERVCATPTMSGCAAYWKKPCGEFDKGKRGGFSAFLLVSVFI